MFYRVIQRLFTNYISLGVVSPQTTAQSAKGRNVKPPPHQNWELWFLLLPLDSFSLHPLRLLIKSMFLKLYIIHCCPQWHSFPFLEISGMCPDNIITPTWTQDTMSSQGKFKMSKNVFLIPHSSEFSYFCTDLSRTKNNIWRGVKFIAETAY